MSATLLSGPTSRTGMNQHLDSIQCTSPAEMISDGTETAVVRRLPSRKRPHPLDRLHHPRLYIFFCFWPIQYSIQSVQWVGPPPTPEEETEPLTAHPLPVDATTPSLQSAGGTIVTPDSAAASQFKW